MFDVRPVTKDGSLDVDRIMKVKSTLKIDFKEYFSGRKKTSRVQSDLFLFDVKKNPGGRPKKEKMADVKDEAKILQMGMVFDSEETPVFHEAQETDFWKNEIPKILEPEREYFIERDDNYSLRKFLFGTNPQTKNFWHFGAEMNFGSNPKKALGFFALAASFIFLFIFGVSFFKKGMQVRENVLGVGQSAYANLTEAKDEILKNNFQDSSFQFMEAYDNFDKISKELGDFGGILAESSRFIPYVSKLSSGKHLAQAGKDVARIGILSGEMMKILNQVKNPLDNSDKNSEVSFLKIFQEANKNSVEIYSLLEDAEENLDAVNVEDIPEKQRVQFVELKNKLPEIKSFINQFLDNSEIFTDVLGGNGPRKYLFLFQNNHEMRATGGFIGSYGVLDIFNGRVNKFFIDGIFNPDGQLREKIIPPKPIQKISAAWSLHDSNWFPDFPVSAEKAIWFYEKTGGPTVDGVITMTPDVMKKLLKISGPIEMPDYEVTIDENNFTQEIQYEVEVDYDKDLNQPKKILADLAPKILDKIFNEKNVASLAKTLDILLESLSEKQILLYSKNYEIEKKISENGWSGQILNTQKDYLSVINSNINGFKTDGIVSENIEHTAEIQDDGSIIDTLTITRQHKGGDSKYEWFNKVNADYMRVYVPKGSVLISAEGQTREFNSPPLDYRALNFKNDPQVKLEEEGIKIDESSGTRIYEDAGKTVFANWVYVSPKEKVVVKYTYLLPFKLTMSESDKPADTYSLLAQKQSGSLGAKFSSNVVYPENYRIIWRYPEVMLEKNSQETRLETDLSKDRLTGLVFTNKLND